MSDTKLTISPRFSLVKNQVKNYIQEIFKVCEFDINQKLNLITCKLINKNEIVEVDLDFVACEDVMKLNEKLLDLQFVQKHNILKTIAKCKLDTIDTESVCVIDECCTTSGVESYGCCVSYQDALAFDYVHENIDIINSIDPNLSVFFHMKMTKTPDYVDKERTSIEAQIAQETVAQLNAKSDMIEILFEEPLNENHIEAFLIYLENKSKSDILKYELSADRCIFRLKFVESFGKKNLFGHKSFTFLKHEMIIKDPSETTIGDEIQRMSHEFIVDTSNEPLLRVLFELDDSHWINFKKNLTNNFERFERYESEKKIELSSSTINQHNDAFNIIQEYLKSNYTLLVIPRGYKLMEFIKSNKNYFVEGDVHGYSRIYASQMILDELISKEVVYKPMLDINETRLLRVLNIFCNSSSLNLERKSYGNYVEFTGKLKNVVKFSQEIDEVLSKKLEKTFDSFDENIIDLIKKDEKLIVKKLSENKILCVIEIRENNVILHAISDEAIQDCKKFLDKLDASFERFILSTSNDNRVAIVFNLGEKHLNRLKQKFQEFNITCSSLNNRSLMLRFTGINSDRLNKVIGMCLNDYKSVFMPKIENLNEQIEFNEDFYVETTTNPNLMSINGTCHAVDRVLSTNTSIKIQTTINYLRFMYVKQVFCEFNALKFDIKQTLITVDGVLSEILRFIEKFNSIKSSLQVKTISSNQIVIAILKENEKKLVKSLFKHKINCVIEFQDTPSAINVISNNENDIKKFDEFLKMLSE